MAPVSTPNGRTRSDTSETPALFEAFPEPRAWALNWDGPAMGQPASTPVSANKVRFVRRG